MSRQEKHDVGKKHRLGGGGRLENHRRLFPSLGLGALQTWDTVCIRARALWHRCGAAVGFLWKFSDLSVTLISSLWARESCIHWQYKQAREHTGEPPGWLAFSRVSEGLLTPRTVSHSPFHLASPILCLCPLLSLEISLKFPLSSIFQSLHQQLSSFSEFLLPCPVTSQYEF